MYQEKDENGLKYADRVDNVDIGTILWLLKRRGGKAYRSGWNGKGMYIVKQDGYPNGIHINGNTSQATGIPEGTLCKFLPYLMMRTAAPEDTFVPWLASQTDILEEDWHWETLNSSKTVH